MSINTRANNQRLPISFLNRKKNEIVIQKCVKSGIFILIREFIIDDEEKKNFKTHNYNTRSKEEYKKIHMSEDDQSYGNIEYTKCVVKALKEALQENEKVSVNFPFSLIFHMFTNFSNINL